MPKVPSDLEIAQAAQMAPIGEVAAAIGLSTEEYDPYGRFKAKLTPGVLDARKDEPDGRLILVTAMNPTPAGEGKTTVSVGLADALHRLGERTILALREPSLGPVFGVKGGAAGGGYAQVVPMEEINLHFTGDIHAIAAANNLLAALLDNHIHQGNALGIDPRRIIWRRCMDMSDRALRQMVVGLGGRLNGMPREDGFDIAVASEVMAIICLATSYHDLKERLRRIVVAFGLDGREITAGDLKAQGAIAALLRDAFRPNLVQTLEHTPTFIHGGPFANIAHGCSSLMATKTALKMADFVVTEAGFGADLGAEKFVDIKCRTGGLTPAACVIVATTRALKYHGGVPRAELGRENPEALRRGLENLGGHLKNVTLRYGLPAVVAINRFVTDSDGELDQIAAFCREQGVVAVRTDVWSHGGAGGEELAREVLRLVFEEENRFAHTYDDKLSLVEKIEAVARKIYGAEGVDFAPAVERELTRLEKQGYGRLPVCIAKTQYSFSDDPKMLGRPSGFRIAVRSVRVSAGAGFVVVLTGDIMTMPGLPPVPAAESIDMDDEGNISGLF